MGYEKVFCVFLIVGAVALQTCRADVCSSQLDNFRVCVRGQMAKDTNDPSASDSRRRQIESDLSTCAISNGCRDPLPADAERQAREACFNDARTEIRQRLQWCVQQQYTDFVLPGDDNDKDAYWNFVLLRSFASMKSVGDNSRNKNRGNKQQWLKFGSSQPKNDICGNDDTKKNNFVNCVKTKGTFNKTSSNSNWRKNSCRIKKQCNQINTQCQQQWDSNSKPKICDCVNTLKNNGSMKTIQENYVKCLKNRQVANVDQTNDDGRVVVQKMLTAWCASGKLNKTQRTQADPCTRPKKPPAKNVTTTSPRPAAIRMADPMADPETTTGTPEVTTTTYAPFLWDTTYDDGTTTSAADINPISGMLGGTDMLTQLTSAPTPAPSTTSGGLFGGLFNSFGSGLFGDNSGGLFGSSGLGGSLISALFGSGTWFDLFFGSAAPVDPTAISSSMGAFGGGGDLFSGFGGDAGNLLGSVPTLA